VESWEQKEHEARRELVPWAEREELARQAELEGLDGQRKQQEPEE